MYIDGTSCATPAFGGLVTLINDVRLRSGQPALGFLNPLLYVRCVGNPPLKRMGLTHWLAAVSCAGTEHGPMARTASSTSSTATTAVLVETAAVVLALACAALRASQVRCITYITGGAGLTSLVVASLCSCKWLGSSFGLGFACVWQLVSDAAGSRLHKGLMHCRCSCLLPRQDPNDDQSSHSWRDGHICGVVCLGIPQPTSARISHRVVPFWLVF